MKIAGVRRLLLYKNYKRRCERRDAPPGQIEARQSRGFWAKGKLRDKSDVIAASAATAAFWLLAMTFLLHRPQNRYRFGDEWDAWSIIEEGIWESIIEGAY